MAWEDPIVEGIGFDPQSVYVESFWLPVLGPSATLLYRRLAWGILDRPDGFDLDGEEFARSLGLGGTGGKHSPFHRALLRCRRFGFTRQPTTGVVAVRRRAAPVPDHHLRRLPPALRQRHRQWESGWQDGRDACTVDRIRHRARQLALDLMAAGPDPMVVERQLLRSGIHPALAYEATGWAHRQIAASAATAREAPACTARNPSAGMISGMLPHPPVAPRMATGARAR